jgi:hypothetical protein
VRESAHVERSAFESRWWPAVVAYLVLAPPMFAGLALEPGGAGLLVFALSTIEVALLSLPAFADLFVDATAPRPASAWLPSLAIYVGAPLAAAALAYAGALVLTMPDPSTPTLFVFLAALWVTTAVYLANQYRHRSAAPPGSRPAA